MRHPRALFSGLTRRSGGRKGPAHNALNKANPDANEADNNEVLKPIKPLCNPLASHRLNTELYNSCENLKSDLHKFTA